MFMGLPFISLYTPSLRYAYYLNGSGTQTLLFRYVLKRGDFSKSFQVLNHTESRYTMETLVFNQVSSYPYLFKAGSVCLY